MSRDKFEAWFKGRYDCGEVQELVWIVCRYAWLAGRESMRDEAAKKADEAWVKNPNDFPGDAIHQIEL